VPGTRRPPGLSAILRWGVYAVVKAPNDMPGPVLRNTASRLMQAAGTPNVQALPPDRAGARISVLSAALRGEPTARQVAGRGDVVAAPSERCSKAGETLEAKVATTVWGKLVPAERSLRGFALPIGLAHKGRSSATSLPAPSCVGPTSMSPTAPRCGTAATWNSALRRRPAPSRRQ